MKTVSINNNLLKLIFFFLPLSYCIGQAGVSFIYLIFVILFFISFQKLSFLYDDKLKILLILYFISLIFGSFFIINLKESLYSSITYSRFLFFFLTVHLFAIFFKERVQNNFFLWSFFLSSLIIIDSHYQYFNPLKENIFGFKPDSEQIGRLTSIFKNELIVGSVLYYLFFTSLIFMVFYINNKFKFFKSSSRIIILLLTLLYLSAVFLSGDRMPFLMAFSTFFLLIIFIKKFRLNFGLIIVIFLLIFFYQIKEDQVFNYRYKAFINQIINQGQKSEINNSRNKNFFDSQWGAHYLTGYEIFKDNYFFGIGLRQFKTECSSKIYENIDSDFRKGRCSNHPHNLYIEMASETGIFSTAILLITILFFFFRCLKIIYNKRIELYSDSYEYALFVAFFVVNFLTFFPLRSSGSFFSNFSGSLIWLNFSFLFIYLKHFESILKKKIKT